MSDQVRVAPTSIDAEISVLGSILQDGGALASVVETLRPEDFYRMSHQYIFAACARLFGGGVPADLVSVSEALRESGQIEAAGGASYLASLVDQVPTAANVAFHAEIVRNKALLRGLIASGAAIMDRAYEADGDARGALDWAERRVFELSERQVARGFVQVSSLLHQALARVHARYEDKRAVTGLATGWARLDDITAGLQPTELFVLAGRPGMGKTAMAMNIATTVAGAQRAPVALFSLEMSREQVVHRLLCSEARVSSRLLRTGYFREADWPRLIAAIRTLSELPIFVDDGGTQTVLEMRAKARRLKAERGLCLVIVDYLQQVSGRGRNENRVQEVSEVSRGLKSMAKDLEVPVLAVAQLSRAVEQRQPPRPQLSDLRDSGTIEQDADVVAFLYRPSYYQRRAEDDVSPVDMTTEVIIGKQRNGPTGTVHLAFLEEYVRFADLAREPGQEG